MLLVGFVRTNRGLLTALNHFQVRQLSSRQTGTVKSFNAKRGWGIIKTQDGTDVLVHYSYINKSGYKSLEGK
jgi:hypothetical protein